MSSPSLHQYNFLNGLSPRNLLPQPSFSRLKRTKVLDLLWSLRYKWNMETENDMLQSYLWTFTVENRNSGKPVLGFTRTSPWRPWTLDMYPTSMKPDSFWLVSAISWVTKIQEKEKYTYVNQPVISIINKMILDQFFVKKTWQSCNVQASYIVPKL